MYNRPSFRVSASIGCCLLFLLQIAQGQPANSKHGTGYDEPLSPVEFGEPLNVYLAMMIESVSDPRPASMDFEVDVLLEIYWDVKWGLCKRYLNETWLRALLLFPPPEGGHMQITQDKVANFWVPDIYFVEAKDVTLPSKITPPRAIKFYNNGKNKNCQMIYKAKETLTVGCNLNFQMYPIEVNKCPLNIRSFTYPSTRLVLGWAPNKRLLVNPNMQMLVCSIEMKAEDEFDEWDNSKDANKFKGIRVIFKFSRNITNQLITTYIPSILLVIVGFSCFWMSVDAGGERITLTITTLLALYTQTTMVRVSIPPTSYITNIDIWLFAALGFILLSTLECAMIQGIYYRERKRQESIDEGELPEEDNQDLEAMKKKNDDFTPANQDPDEDWEDEPSDPNLSRMYHAIRKENLFFQRFQRRDDQSYTEYCDNLGKKILIGSFVIFFFCYVMYMLICYAINR